MLAAGFEPIDGRIAMLLLLAVGAVDTLPTSICTPTGLVSCSSQPSPCWPLGLPSRLRGSILASLVALAVGGICGALAAPRGLTVRPIKGALSNDIAQHPSTRGALAARHRIALFAADAAFADVLNDIGNGYKTESAKWFPKLLVIAKSLFWKLAAIEFAWASILWVLKSQEMQSFTAAVVKAHRHRVLLLAAKRRDYWIPAIVNSLVKAGNEATGLPALTPSEGSTWALIRQWRC